MSHYRKRVSKFISLPWGKERAKEKQMAPNQDAEGDEWRGLVMGANEFAAFFVVPLPGGRCWQFYEILANKFRAESVIYLHLYTICGCSVLKLMLSRSSVK